MKIFPFKITAWAKMTTLALFTTVLRILANQTIKGNKRNPNWKGSSKILTVYG